ncbi:hypothetical protein ACFQAT_12500 [Undibacterium arcticum]|uniref:Uncharacterized protein n=1 Tax=Undibacterium arcticum TaxID=1762892 RepID=A0ABV7F2N0_9BURK
MLLKITHPIWSELIAHSQSGIGTSYVLHNTSFVTQGGHGFIANVNQSGSDKHSGVYQH